MADESGAWEATARPEGEECEYLPWRLEGEDWEPEVEPEDDPAVAAAETEAEEDWPEGLDPEQMLFGMVQSMVAGMPMTAQQIVAER